MKLQLLALIIFINLACHSNKRVSYFDRLEYRGNGSYLLFKFRKFDSLILFYKSHSYLNDYSVYGLGFKNENLIFISGKLKPSFKLGKIRFKEVNSQSVKSNLKFDNDIFGRLLSLNDDSLNCHVSNDGKVNFTESGGSTNSIILLNIQEHSYHLKSSYIIKRYNEYFPNSHRGYLLKVLMDFEKYFGVKLIVD